jgi:hypothetical protein
VLVAVAVAVAVIDDVASPLSLVAVCATRSDCITDFVRSMLVAQGLQTNTVVEYQEEDGLFEHVCLVRLNSLVRVCET